MDMLCGEGVRVLVEDLELCIRQSWLLNKFCQRLGCQHKREENKDSRGRKTESDIYQSYVQE